MAWFFPLLLRLASVGITLLYPAWGSINAIESSGTDDDTQWLVYWLCYAIFNMIENSLWIVFQWVPGYSLFRIAVFAWLALPQTKGATFVYEAVLAPIVSILRREISKNPSLDRTFNKEFAQGANSGTTSQARASKLQSALDNANSSFNRALEKINGLSDPSQKKKAERAFDKDVSRINNLAARS
ncbi:hypothetical protein WJX84_011355 [Apatococcus fuscideae]|uniref:HVA22-like protein n=1 Tax=Apatococcus fuscideae TaxID=2026836 RepID=A0AAW1T002_9CHLO